jgi:ferredoxin-nitrate reductase
LPPAEEPNSEYPFWLSTGRTVYQFHTRTKTGRSPPLNAAAPEPIVELHADDAKALGVNDGDLVEITGRRGSVKANAKIGGILPGHAFLPFHFGYWDQKQGSGPDGQPTAANELTLTAWDPVSKQPHYKFAAVRLDKVGRKPMTSRVTDLLEETVDRAKEIASVVLARGAHPEHSRFNQYLTLIRDANNEFQTACRHIADDHPENAEIVRGTELLRGFARQANDELQPFLEQYGSSQQQEPQQLRKTLFPSHRHGDFGLLRDLHALFLLASEIGIATEIAEHAAQEIRDPQLLELCGRLHEVARRQKIWCQTQVKENAAQSLVVPH